MNDLPKNQKTLLRWASGIMVVLGAGHLALLSLMSGKVIAAWGQRGLWATVPLGPETAPTVDSLINKVVFWAGPGSFSAPLILLGALTWQLANRGVAVPAAIGWGLAGWCIVGGVLLVPSPFFVGAIAGILIVVASRKTKAFPAALA